MIQNSKILLCIKGLKEREQLFEILIDTNCNVIIFDYSIDNIIDYLKDNLPDLIIADLPSINLVLSLKKNENPAKYRHLPILLLIEKIEDLSQNIAEKISEFILAPFSEKEIIFRVNNALKMKKCYELLESDVMNLENKTKLKESELLKLKEYNKFLIDAIPMSILVIDSEMRIKFVNEKFVKIRNTKIDYVINKYLNEIFNFDFYNSRLKIEVNKAMYSKETRVLTNVSGVFYDLSENIFDMTIIPITLSTAEEILMIVFDDITHKKKSEFYNSIVQELLSYIQDVIDLDKILFIILTCVTAGAGIGFSRAFLLLFDEGSGKLEGKFCVGPENQDDANRIWSELSQTHKTLRDYINDYDKHSLELKKKHKKILEKLIFEKSEIDESLKLCFREKRALRFENNFEDSTFIGKIGRILEVGEFVVAPLISDNKPIGIIIADNKYSYKKIDKDNLIMLTMYATHAAQSIAIANANATLLSKGNELLKTKEQLQISERLASIGKLAANISHEIRNPLTTIGGYANRILKYLKQGNIYSIQTAASIISKETERLEELLSNIMDFSRSGIIKKSLCSIKDVIENSLLLLQESLRENNILIHYDENNGDVELMCDPQKMKQVFINILKNSIDAIKSRKLGAGVIKIYIYCEIEYCVVKIEDNGCGISKEDLENIYSLFFTTKEFGTGLGMAIIKNIIDAHKGTIEYTSIVNEGTTVRIKLPII